MMAQIIRSLILLTTISSSIGGLYYLGYGSFLKPFLITTIIQIIFFILYNNILRYFAKLNLEKESLQLAQLAEKNKIFIECQACKNTNNVDIDLTKENKFLCSSCGAENKINIEYNTVLPTKIIYDN